jgi:cytochrome P450
MAESGRVYDPFSYETDEDPYPVYRWMRDEAPVYRNEEMDFTLTRSSDNLHAFIDKDGYTSTWSTSLEFMNEPHPDSGLMIWMDPPEHNRFRGLVSKAFTPRRIADLEPRIRAIATGYLDALVGRERFDVVKEFTARLPMDVISSLLGIPDADRRWVQEGSNAMLHRDPGSPLPRPEAIEATQRCSPTSTSKQIAERRARATT